MTDKPDWNEQKDAFMAGGVSAADLETLREHVTEDLLEKFDEHDMGVGRGRARALSRAVTASMLEYLDRARPDEHELHVEMLLEDFEAEWPNANVELTLGTMIGTEHCPDELYELAGHEMGQ